MFQMGVDVLGGMVMLQGCGCSLNVQGLDLGVRDTILKLGVACVSEQSITFASLFVVELLNSTLYEFKYN